MKRDPNTGTTDDPLPEKPRKSLLRRLLNPWMLLVVVTFGALTWVGVQVQRRRAEVEALTQLKSIDDGRSFNLQLSNPFQPDDPPQLDIMFAGGPQWMTDWLGVDLLATVARMQVMAPGSKFSYGRNQDGRLVINRTYQSGIAGDETRLLGNFANLQGLSLEAHPVGDEIGPVLDRLPNLEGLNLANTTISDTVLPHVARLKHLSFLNISRTDVTDDGMKHLSKLSALESLNVSMTNVSDEAVERLRQQLPHCQIER